MSLPNVHFGEVDKAVDWRKKPVPDEVDDDEQLAVTPPDVVGILGFDPATEPDED